MSTLFEDLTSGDTHQVWSASGGILQLWNLEELDSLAIKLPEIRSRVESLELGGALFPNQVHLQTALARIEYARDRKGCLCRLYPTYILYNPQREEKEGHIRIINTTYIEDKWVEHYNCECTTCGANFRVSEAEYHYTWWSWNCLEPDLKKTSPNIPPTDMAPQPKRSWIGRLLDTLGLSRRT